MDIELVSLTPANLQQLKVINTTTLPVKYSDKFYNDLLTTYKSEYIKLAFSHGFSIGGVCARVEDHPDLPGKKRLYIMTINVLAAYRKKGVGMYDIFTYCAFSDFLLSSLSASRLLNHIIEQVSKDKSIVDIYLHVQLGNDAAKSFYEKQGFQQIDIIKDYYKRIDPPDCYLFVKSLQV
jgi:GNAT superfamily N-acetyltransferase